MFDTQNDMIHLFLSLVSLTWANVLTRGLVWEELSREEVRSRIRPESPECFRIELICGGKYWK